MKSFMLSCLCLIIAVNLFAQQPTLSKADCLQKSKDQKIVAWVLLGSGITAMVAGLGITARDLLTTDNNTGPILFSIGLVSSLGSIPLFIASSRNKRLAATLSFKNEKLHLRGNTSLALISMPALSLKINL